MSSALVTIVALVMCGAALAERMPKPDVSWNSRGSNDQSDRAGVFEESNIRPSSLRQSDASAGGSQFAGSSNGKSINSGSSFSSNSDDRFPITGSRFAGSGSDSRRPSSGGSNFGSSSSVGGDRNRDQDFDRPSSSSSSQDRNYVQIVAALVRLSNSGGKTSTGGGCASFGGKCDPLVYANLDIERPNSNWPGAQDTKFWPLLLSAKDQNDLAINIVNITKQYCGQTYKEANLRVRIEDKKMLTSNAVINEFDCVINRDPARDEFSATWSPEQSCIPRFPKGGQVLTYKYKVYYVDKFGCGATARPTTTTKKGWFGGK